MKKLLFIRTATDVVYWRTVAPPLGLLYLTATIRGRYPSRYDIKIIDMQLYRLSPKDLEDLIRDFDPDIIGCSVVSVDHECMNEVADLCKKIKKDVKLIIGGPHPTMYLEDAFRNKNIDVAVIGEAEETICDLLECIERGGELCEVRGIALREKDSIIRTGDRPFISDLYSIHFPEWDLIPLHKYSEFENLPLGAMLAGKRYMSVFTSRGCPYQCVYCHNIFGKTYRVRSIDNVMEEIMELYNKYDIDELHILDDIFNLEKKRTEKICDAIIASGIKIWISFPNGLRADILDERLLDKLKSAGTYFIMFALETASPRMQKIIKKNVDIEKLNEMIEAVDRRKILTKCFFMLGFPGETPEEMRKTVNFACNSRSTYASFMSVTPQKSTELFQMVKRACPEFSLELNKANYFTPSENYIKGVVKFPLSKLIMRAYLRFFLNPARLMRIILLTPRKIFLVIQLYYLATMFFPYYFRKIINRRK